MDCARTEEGCQLGGERAIPGDCLEKSRKESQVKPILRETVGILTAEQLNAGLVALEQRRAQEGERNEFEVLALLSPLQTLKTNCPS